MPFSMVRALPLLALTLASLPAATITRAQVQTLIPRQLVFGNPERAAPAISPDGKQIAWLAPLDGVMNVWVAPRGALQTARPVTSDKGRGIRSFFWAFTSAHVLYTQDKGGDENWRVYATDIAAGTTRDLTPYDGVQARIQEVSPRHPDEVLVAINNRNPQLHDIHRVNIRSGAMQMVQINDRKDGPPFLGFLTDENYNVRFGIAMLPDGGQEILRPAADGAWTLFQKIDYVDTLTTSPAGFNAAGDVLYMLDSRGRDTAALTALDVKSGATTLLAEDERADVDDTLFHPTTKQPQAAASVYDRKHWKVLDAGLKEDFAYLAKLVDGEFDLVSRTLDDQVWVVGYNVDTGPLRYFVYDRAAKKADLLFVARPQLEGLKLARMHPVMIPARDKLTLVSYLSLPPAADPDGDGKPDKPLPLVLLVHGGPWARDVWGYNTQHQWLANRGYAVLSVNFRGSTGFGKRFVNAADLQWATRMHDDLIDAVNWASSAKIADPAKIAIMGGSYGGYATLVGLTFTPDTFACGVDIVGPSNLITLIESIPPYWKPMLETFARRVGDIRTEQGRALLKERSPLTRVDKIKRPLLIGQGANDPRVKQAEADQIVGAMRERKIPVTYVLYPDEGHGFARPENRLSFYAVTEAFLGAHLGGAVEPIGDDFEGSSLRIPQGADQIPGIDAALSKVPAGGASTAAEKP